MERSVILEPTTEKQRFIILDALRGLALLGICLANLPEFALWTFLSGEEQAAMPTAEADRVARFLQYFIVDAKFYSIFSILYYGIGFGMGLDMGLWQVELTAIGIFLAQIVCSHVWMKWFRYGPLEWVWRMLTYGRWLDIRK